jgi:hypothetical protein
MSLKFAKELYLHTHKVGKPTNVRFGKGKPHGTNEVALNVNLKCRTLRFVEGFTFSETNEVDLVLEDTFIETHTMDVKHMIRLVVCHDSKNLTLKLKMTPITERG